MKLRVVIDSNVYISAVVFGGTPKALLTLAEMGHFELCTCPAIHKEVERTLNQKFKWPQDRIEQACSPLWAIAHHVAPASFLSVTVDPDDNRIVECAVAGGAQFIVTGDDHLQRLKVFQEIVVLSPRAFLNLHSS